LKDEHGTSAQPGLYYYRADGGPVSALVLQ
jgi:hypothetical protein